MKAALIGLLAAAFAASGATAADIDDRTAAFTEIEGFTVEDAFALEGHLGDVWTRTDLLTPGGGVGPVEKAVLLAGLDDAASRTRTAISYGSMIVDQGGVSTPYAFVELRRYNLGPAIRNQLIEELGEDAVAPLEEFGEGQHRAWRLVFTPVMGTEAALIAASHREISDDEAADDDCTGRPCLDPYATLDELRDWEENDPQEASWLPDFAEGAEGIATDAYAIALIELAQHAATIEGGNYRWTGGEQPEAVRDETPHRFYAIDRNLGQETAVDTVGIQTELNDDSVREIATRRVEIADEAYWFIAPTPR